MSDAENPTAVPADDDAVAARLRELGVNDDTITKVREDLGVESVDDLPLLTGELLASIGMRPVPAARLVAALKPAPAVAGADAANSVQLEGILPTVMDDSSWLDSLRAGGVLKVNTATVMAAIRAALAYRVGLYKVPELLVDAMERFAEESEEPVDPSYFALRAELTRRSYGDIFSAVPGLDGNYVTEKRKRALFERIDRELWPAIASFYSQLKEWQDLWLHTMQNPAALMTALAGGGSALQASLMQPPDAGSLRDQAAEVANAVNRVFAGTGVQIAAALASEATQIRNTLENTDLPRLVGAPNREQMLRMLGVAVGPAYPRLEQTLTKFVLSVLEAQRQTADTEPQYYTALLQLASQMPWSEVGISDGKSGVGRITPIGGASVRELGRSAISSDVDHPRYR